MSTVLYGQTFILLHATYRRLTFFVVVLGGCDDHAHSLTHSLTLALVLFAHFLFRFCQVRAAREFPEDLVRLSIGIESAEDLIADLSRAMQSYSAPGPAAAAKAAASASAAAASTK